ncbi:MAG: DUF3631 domain-containing protein [Fimbriimonadaceae bacterium]
MSNPSNYLGINDQPLPEAALAYGELGRRVVPIHGIVDGWCTCGDPDCESPGKHPRFKGWQQEATCDPAKIREWWKKCPHANIGLLTGGQVNALDSDPRNGGDKSLEGLLMEHGKFPDCPVQDTGGGGNHFLFATPIGLKSGEHPGIDVKGEGGFIVVAPSNHISGKKYQWQLGSELGAVEVPPAPGWLARRAAPKVLASPAEQGEKYTKGGRNNYLASIAGRLRRAGLAEDEIEGALKVTNARDCLPPLGNGEVAKIAKSIGGYPSVEADRVNEIGRREGAESLAEALSAVEAFLSRFVVLPSVHDGVAITLWTAHTYCVDQADTSPYLSVSSAEKQCGKTRLLDVLEVLVHNPWRIVSVSEAVVFRKIDKDKPTLMLDEVDTVFGPNTSQNNEGLRALLNAGNRKGTRVPRIEGKDFKIREFDVFCPKALAGIGKLPPTVADRSIPIRLRRKKRTEGVERFKNRVHRGIAREIGEDLQGWIASSELPTDPVLPDCLSDRAHDGWELLFAIAAAAGGAWPERARLAATMLMPSGDDDDSLSLMLLRDLRAIFTEEDRPKWPSATLIERLKEIEDAPWRDLGKDGVTANKLAGMLRPYGIKSKNVRHGDGVPKGYLPCDFEDTFERYLTVAATEEG